MVKPFARFARKARIKDEGLLGAADDIAAGQFDADLGGGLYKQRIAREGGGKSGGYRVVLAFRAKARVVFLVGYAKSDKADLTPKEQESLRLLAGRLLGFDDAAVTRLVEAGEWTEIEDGQG